MYNSREFYIFSGIWTLDINNGFLNRVIMNDLLNFILVFSNDYNLNNYSKNIYMLFDSKEKTSYSDLAIFVNLKRLLIC